MTRSSFVTVFVTLAIASCLIVATSSTPPCRFSVVGAGFGGLTGAYVALNSSLYPASTICVFEMTDRVGGRAYTSDAFTGIASKVNLGARRWDSNMHPAVESFITKVLRLNSACTGACDDGASRRANRDTFFDLRGVYNGTGRSSLGRKFPYHVDPSEEWGRGVPFPDPVEAIFGLFPILGSLPVGDADPAVRYPAIKAVLDAIRYTPVLDGLLPTQLTVRTALNRSQEFWNFWLDSIGEAEYYLDTTLYEAVRTIAWYSVQGSLGEAYRVITDAQGNEVGFQAKDTALAALLQSAGVRIRYRKELVSLKRGHGTSLILGFADGSTVVSEGVLLNIPVTQLKMLSHDSVIFTGANPQTVAMYDLISPVPAVKAYGYWQDAWWPGQIHPQAAVSTTRSPMYINFGDSAVSGCDGQGSNCRGWLNMAYPDGDRVKSFSYPQSDRSDPAVVIHSNTTDPMERKWFYDFVNAFRMSVCNATGLPPSLIPPPSTIAMGIWPQGWHNTLASNHPGGVVEAETLLPVPGLKIIYGNEDASDQQGWANGAVQRVLRGLKRLYGISRPSWLGNQPWWDNIIASPLI